MVRSYLEVEGTIIVAVSSGNVDIANSRSIKLAKDFDRDMSRTICVVTKIDLCSSKDSLVNTLSGGVIPSKYPFVGVRLRSRKDTEEGVPVLQCINQIEQEFLQDEAFEHVRDHCGIPYLLHLLSDLLIHSLKTSLPNIYKKLRSALEQCDKELAHIGTDEMEDNIVIKTSEMINFLSKFHQNYNQLMSGTGKRRFIPSISSSPLTSPLHRSFPSPPSRSPPPLSLSSSSITSSSSPLLPPPPPPLLPLLPLPLLSVNHTFILPILLLSIHKLLPPLLYVHHHLLSHSLHLAYKPYLPLLLLLLPLPLHSQTRLRVFG